MSGSEERDRLALDEIERDLAAQYPWLARRLRHPSWWIKLWWGQYRIWVIITAAVVMFGVLELLLEI